MAPDPMQALWLAFAALAGVMLAVDLGVARSAGAGGGTRAAARMTLLWIACALGFAALIHVTLGHARMFEFATGYLIEYALSVDNLFVFLVLFAHFDVPREHQRRVLLWGILSAIVLRLAFVVSGAALLRRFHWFDYVLGAFVLATALRLLQREPRGVDPARSRVLRAFQRVVPTVPRLAGRRFLIRVDGRLHATLLLLVLVLIEATDILFALDSIPAVFAVTQDPFIVYTSNVFSVAGLRSLYVVIAALIGRLAYLHYGLAATLLFVGAKLLLHEWLHVPAALSLLVVAAILATATVASLAAARSHDG